MWFAWKLTINYPTFHIADFFLVVMFRKLIIVADFFIYNRKLENIIGGSYEHV